jgi:hypothetical protein
LPVSQYATEQKTKKKVQDARIMWTKYRWFRGRTGKDAAEPAIPENPSAETLARAEARLFRPTIELNCVWHSAAALSLPARRLFFLPRGARFSAKSWLNFRQSRAVAKSGSSIRASRFGALDKVHQAAFPPGLTGFFT